jgi:hypothetical protein
LILGATKAVAWFQTRLDEELIRRLHVDGFKFDGGDPEYYRHHGAATGVGKLTPHGHCEAFGRVGVPKYNITSIS